jgi:RimJ/RimL family protein N-acetyltransferase
VITDNSFLIALNWRAGLPPLTSRQVSLREPSLRDSEALLPLLSLDAATRFGIDQPVCALAVRSLIERALSDRAAGIAFTYVITLNGSKTVVGLFQVRQLDPSFEGAVWECLILPSSRGSGVFLEAARLVGSFAFGTVGVHRLEARVSLANGRANGALRKLGAVQEGVLRRSLHRAGAYLDQALWSLLKEDWAEHWVATAARVH